MAGEIQFRAPSGNTCYAVVRSSAGQVWNTNTAAFENFTAANYAHYGVSCTEQGTTGVYVGNMPTTNSDVYSLVGYVQGGASPAQSDTATADGEVIFVAGKTPAKSLTYIGAAVAGQLPSGAGTGQENYKDFAGNAAVDVTIDGTGNRTAVTYH